MFSRVTTMVDLATGLGCGTGTSKGDRRLLMVMLACSGFSSSYPQDIIAWLMIVFKSFSIFSCDVT